MKEFFAKNKATLILLLLLTAVILALLVVKRLEGINKGEEITINSGDSSSGGDVEAKKIKVDISGEVKNPGVYELGEGAIVNDAIEAAGGFTEKADLGYVSQNINKAKKLIDEEKIYIPPIEESQVNGTSVSSDSNKPQTVSKKVNINTATVSELDTLPGVGEAIAKRIIDGRPYSKIEDIKKVKGIGDSIYEEIKDLITV